MKYDYKFMQLNIVKNGLDIYSNSFGHDLTNTKALREHSGSVLDSRPRGRGLEPHRRHWVVSLSKTHLS